MEKKERNLRHEWKRLGRSGFELIKRHEGDHKRVCSPGLKIIVHVCFKFFAEGAQDSPLSIAKTREEKQKRKRKKRNSIARQGRCMDNHSRGQC